MRHLLPLLLLAACDEKSSEDSGETYSCDLMARHSVALTLQDPDGSPITGASVTYNIVGEDAEPQPCSEGSAGLYNCGTELAGEFSLSIAADGYASDSLTLTVGTDECGPVTEALTHTLDPVECTAEAVPALLVTVTDGQGAMVKDALVQWSTAKIAATACSGGVTTNTWTCAEEVTGDITLSVVGDPYQPYEQVITVESTAEGCHPVTESVDVVLQYLPD